MIVDAVFTGRDVVAFAADGRELPAIIDPPAGRLIRITIPDDTAAATNLRHAADDWFHEQLMGLLDA